MASPTNSTRQFFRASDIHPISNLRLPSAQAQHRWHQACAACQVTSATPPPPSANIQLPPIEYSSPIPDFCWVAVRFRTASWCLNTTQICHSIPSTFRLFTLSLSPACSGHPMAGRDWLTAPYLDLFSPHTSSPYPLLTTSISFPGTRFMSGRIPSHFGCNRRAPSVTHCIMDKGLFLCCAEPLLLSDKSPPSSLVCSKEWFPPGQPTESWWA
ncbi:hypothetical protein B0H65DRAFT_210942 [Neurospora tetraspora]|uniref:Uncharacterized protein n=1 Tax=Neurospora tetraspora TaxID=94610 RepID=A0AAE0MTI3_9PEZI|nr:hypothetical protein B0H65DRAFT_210942 [Neurospora tetraspora]